MARDLGIGGSKDVHSRIGADPEKIGGANTAEGDVMNDVTPQGAVSPGRQGRTDK